MGQLFTIALFEMKVLLAISTLMVVANAMPTQYVLVPLNQLHYIQPQYHHRVARSAWPQDGGPPGGPGAFVIPADSSNRRQSICWKFSRLCQCRSRLRRL